MHTRHSLLFLILLACAGLPAQGAEAVKSCYTSAGLETPAGDQRALYILVDQTMALPAEMQAAIAGLVSDWDRSGDRVKIVRFSANVRGQYTELMFDGARDLAPDEPYLFHLPNDVHDTLLACLEKNRSDFRRAFVGALGATLTRANSKIPKTELFYSLRTIAHDVLKDGIEDKTVLLITDGLENSAYLNLHRGKPFKPIDGNQVMAKLRKEGLLPDWGRAKIYVYGLGYLGPGKGYVRAQLLESVKGFWGRYFAAANGRIQGLGTPALLVTSLR